MKRISGVSLILLWVMVAIALNPTGVFAYDSTSPMVLKCAIDNPPVDMKAQTIKKNG